MTLPAAYFYVSVIHTFGQLMNGNIQWTDLLNNYNLRTKGELVREHCNTKKAHDFVTHSGKRFFNKLPLELRQCKNEQAFRFKVKALLLHNPPYKLTDIDFVSKGQCVVERVD